MCNREIKKYFKSFCDIRNETGLGCKDCELDGFQECPEHVGASDHGHAYQMDHSYRARVRGELGFPVHIEPV